MEKSPAENGTEASGNVVGQVAGLPHNYKPDTHQT
jgi:hypothetical protein